MSTAGAYSQRRAFRPFTAIDYYDLSEDRYGRFKPSLEPYISYVLVSKNREGEDVAQQFEFPLTDDPNFPRVEKLKQISFENNIQATTEDGHQMTTQRSISIEVCSSSQAPMQYGLYFFSPYSLSTVSQNLTLVDDGLEEDVVSDESNHVIQRGGTLDIKYSHILARQNHRAVLPEQNEVMGYSARDAYINFYHAYKSFLPYQFNTILLRSIKADPYLERRSMGAYKRPEWLHALAKQFHPVYMNPQRVDNLGAAPLWLNSQMMIFENALGWLAKAYPEAKIKLSSHFNMFGETDVIFDGEMEGVIERANTIVKICQSLDPHQLYPAYPQATDIALTTFVVNNLLHGLVPNAIFIESRQPNPSPFSDQTETSVASSISLQSTDAISGPATIDFGLDEQEKQWLDQTYSESGSATIDFGLDEQEKQWLDQACSEIDLDAIISGGSTFVTSAPVAGMKRERSDDNALSKPSKIRKLP